MILRIGAVLAVLSGVGTSAVVAQGAALGLRPSTLFAPLPAARPDSVIIHPTYWKEGALIGGVVGGILGGMTAAALCSISEEPGGGTACDLLPALGAVVVGAAIVAIPGALIGGQIEKQ